MNSREMDKRELEQLKEQYDQLLLSPRIVMKLFGTSRPTLWRMVNSGQLKVVKIRNSVKFSVKEINRFIDQGGTRDVA